jgi:parallel beta-helix repeat protein
VCEIKESETRLRKSGTKEEVAMYHQINPTEMFRERQLALIREAQNRRLLRRRLRVARRTPKARSTLAAALGFLAALVVASLMLVASSSPAHAQSNFFVNSTADFADASTADGLCTAAESIGECTFRAAIEQANATPGADNILFGIPSDGVATIRPSSPLPEITDRVTIDGYTNQQGTSPNTLAQGTNAVLEVELDGTNAGTEANGLVIGPGGSGSVVKGLVINRFTGDGIVTLGGSQDRIEGNFIGTDPSGTLDLGNSTGVNIFASTSNTVGGNSPAARNLISGNRARGVEINGAGGPTSFNRVLGNLIGTKKDGTTALGNASDGMEIPFSTNNTVSANTIAFNRGDGVEITKSATGNLLAGNSIFSNVEEGIDLNDDGVTLNDSLDTDIGPNTLQNKPLLTSARTSRKATTIKGKLNSTPNKTFLVQFFSNASGDEGQRVIGQTGLTTDPSGNASFTFNPALKVRKGKITATATETASKNTSEFSAAKKVVRKR